MCEEDKGECDVFLCSPTNSQMFTTCCECAVCDDQSECPRCGAHVRQETSRARWNFAYRRGLKRLL